jgi:hypothetical protein
MLNTLVVTLKHNNVRLPGSEAYDEEFEDVIGLLRDILVQTNFKVDRAVSCYENTLA